MAAAETKKHDISLIIMVEKWSTRSLRIAAQAPTRARLSGHLRLIIRKKSSSAPPSRNNPLSTFWATTLSVKKRSGIISSGYPGGNALVGWGVGAEMSVYP